MIIVQLDNEQLSELIQNSVRKALNESQQLPTGKQPETDQFLTIQKAAEMLCLSVPTIYGLVHDAKIPVSKKGKRLYFSKQELTEWIKTGRKKTVSEISSEADNYLLKKRS